MENDFLSKQYRIGDFSHYMGVTPDFLKYYEQFQLVSSVVKSNGYHYYPFVESYRILECMRLRNYGISIKDMNHLLNEDDSRTVEEKLNRRVEELKERIIFEQAVVEEHQWFAGWLKRVNENQEEWQVSEGEEMYFLPHSNRHDFLEDERIYDILKDWVSWMPMVKSCMRIPRQGNDSQKELLQSGTDFDWGLIVTRKFAERYGIPVNEAVRVLPVRRWFFYSFAGMRWKTEDRLFDPEHRAMDRLRRLGLRPEGDVYKVMYMYTHIGTSPEQYGVLMIPIS